MMTDADKRRDFSKRFFLAGVVLASFAAYGFLPGNEGSAAIAAALALGSVMCWMVAFGRLAPDIAVAGQSTASPSARLSLRWLPLLTGVMALGLLALVNVAYAAYTGSFTALLFLAKTPARMQMALLFGGSVLVGWGLAGRPQSFVRTWHAVSLQGRNFNLSDGRGTPRPYDTIILFAGVLVLAFALRVVNLEYAVHRFVDEIHSAAAVAHLRETPTTPILTHYGTITSFPWVYPQMQAWAVELYRPTLTALRVISALFGTATVGAVWWLARVLFPQMRWLPLLAALLLATFPPHVHFSRLGLNNIADPLFGTLALALVWRGLRDGRQGDFAWAGVMLGLTQVFYEGGRLLYPPLTVGTVVVWWMVGKRRNDVIALMAAAPLPFAPPQSVEEGLGYANYSLPQDERMRGAGGRVKMPPFQLAAGLLAFALVAAPLYITTWAHRLPAAARFEKMSYLARPEMAEETALVAGVHALRDVLWHFVQRPEESWFYGGETALILPWLIPALLAGVALLLRWGRRVPALGVVGLWLLGVIVGNSLLYQPTFSARYVVAHPAAALVLALGLWALAQRVTPRPLVLVTVAVLIAAGQTTYYFRDHLPVYNRAAAINNALDDVFFRAVTLPRGTRVHFITSAIIPQFNITSYLRYRGRLNDLVIEVVRPQDVTVAYLENLAPNIPRAFFIAATDDETPARLRAFLRLEPPLDSPYDLPPEQQYWLYYAPRSNER
ncbi:MAG: glycosyltransferase family 39 protein [bacterium]|nr:glycosyltransferase family 39 protein [bacterium]